MTLKTSGLNESVGTIALGLDGTNSYQRAKTLVTLNHMPDNID